MNITEFRRGFNSATTHGWLSAEEALILIDYASRTEGKIVEVGSYHGRSASLLVRLKRPLICIDPWADGFSDDPGDKVYASFCQNIYDTGLSGYMTALRMSVADWTPEPAGFVYLDGDHTRQGTVTQIEKALKCNPQTIGIHDVNDSGGGLAIKEAAIELLGDWSERVERLAIWRLK